MWHDLRYAIRMLTKSPGFTVVTVLTLALGIGANSAIFTVVNAVLLRPLPYPDADRVVQVWESRRGRPDTNSVSPKNFEDWARDAKTMEAMAIYSFEAMPLTASGEAERLVAVKATSSFFRVMGTPAQIGRHISNEEDQPGGPCSVVLSHALWQRRFGGDAKVLGQVLTLDGTPHTVVGVMPAEFRFPSTSTEMWVPLGLDFAKENRGNHYVFSIGRMKPSVDLATAQAELDAISVRLEKDYPDTNYELNARLVPLQEQVVGGSRGLLILLLSAVGFVLLIACTNVTNLLLARAATRQRELAIRRALGATSGRLARQFFTEGLLLSLAGGLTGWLVAMWGTDLLLQVQRGLPRAQEVRLDATVFLFTLAVLLAVGLALGLAQTFQSARGDVNRMLQDSGSRGAGAAGGVGRARLRGSLVVAEVALAILLLVGAGLLMKTFYALAAVPTGFSPDVLSLRLDVPRNRYPAAAQQVQFVAQILDAVAALPGVEVAGATNELPFSGSRTASSFDISGRNWPRGGGPQADRRHVSPGYFRAMGIPLIRGRAFSAQDHLSSAPVIIINETLARRYWPGEDALGHSLILMGVQRQIVGIVGDVRHMRLRAPAEAEMYVPFLQTPSDMLALAVRPAAAGPAALMEPVRRAVLQVDPDQPAYSIRTMGQRLEGATSGARANMVLMGIFAGLAALLAAIGLYGVMAYGVTERTHEFGIRMALGAEPRDVLQLVMRGGMRLVLLGLVIGLGAALALSRYISTLLYGVQPTDAATYAAVAVLLAVVALAACWIPARRATKVDPIVALRYE